MVMGQISGVATYSTLTGSASALGQRKLEALDVQNSPIEDMLMPS